MTNNEEQLREQINTVVTQGIEDMIQKINDETGIVVDSNNLYYGDEEDFLELAEQLTDHLFLVYSRDLEGGE